jgi:hypothetical protein
LPTCPKCGKFISEKHYERHLQRCGTIHEREPEPLHGHSATAPVQSVDSADRGVTAGPPEEEHGGGINWRKVGALLLIFLLVGTLVVFFILYAVSLL